MFRPTRQFKLVALAVLFALSTVHCSPAGPVPTGTHATPVPPTLASSEATPERIQLTYVSFLQGYTVGLNRAEQELIKRFEAAHPDIKINRKDYYGSFEEIIAGTPPPDVMTAGVAIGPFLEDEVAQGRLTDLSDLWAQQHWEATYPSQLQTLSAVQGKRYFLPTLAPWTAIYYNRSLFERYQLTPPETWDEFLAVCETLKQNEVTPLAIGNKYHGPAGSWFDYLNLRLNGAEFHAALMSGQVQYDDARVRQVFETWNVLVASEYFIPDADRLDNQESSGMVLRGEAAMLLAEPYVWEAYGEAEQSQVDFFRFPTISGQASSGEQVSALGYVMPANAPNPAAAQAWLAYLGSSEAQTILAQGIGIAPANTEVDSNLLSPSAQKGIALIQASGQASPYFSLDLYYLNQFLMGREDIDSVLADLEKDRQKKFGQAESP